ncbi:hypothetical protein BBI01_01185 [Chryseobacterium artocarpi]|uniref:Uncharacterized protein n=1 Tax=Chryseobacterium artocarpi TaxID=1414727 RepID=A0A1B8ZZT8_9FLAO|nr:hypothetical protein [Chryseobacterium artocarpi]OCA77105.1 hypothetical protein BBI01_01185 [Chryseobacterium artocarpi]
MTSKQLNFFITDRDLELISDFFKGKSVKILLESNISDNYEIQALNQLPDKDMQSLVYLCDSKFLNEIEIKSTKNGVKYFDILSSSIMEFSSGGFDTDDQNTIHRGRFYYVKSFYNKFDDLEKKSNSYIEWCDNIIRRFKKEFLKKYSNDKEDLYSQSAIEWIENNNAVKSGGGFGWKKPL